MKCCNGLIHVIFSYRDQYEQEEGDQDNAIPA